MLGRDKHKNLYTAEEDALIASMREDGYSFPQIGKALNRSAEAVSVRLRRIEDDDMEGWPMPERNGDKKLVDRQIATGQYNPIARVAWLQRHS